jgi:hypothetical protein
MKKLLFFATAAALTLTVACKKKTTDDGNGGTAFAVENKQKSILVYNTATWCGPCGTYGGPMFKSVLSNPDLISIDLHTSGSSYLVPYYMRAGGTNDTLFLSTFASRIAAQTKPNGYIPHFYTNNTFLGNSEVTKVAVENAVNIFKVQTPAAGVAVKASNSNNKITIDYKAKSFAANTGDYHLSLLLVEKSITGYQAGAPGSITEHHNIVRATAFGTVYDQSTGFSTNAVLSNPAAGQEVSGTQTFQFEALPIAARYSNVMKWNYSAANTMVVAILWKKNGAAYDFVNISSCDVK